MLFLAFKFMAIKGFVALLSEIGVNRLDHRGLVFISAADRSLKESLRLPNESVFFPLEIPSETIIEIHGGARDGGINARRLSAEQPSVGSGEAFIPTLKRRYTFDGLSKPSSLFFLPR